MRDTPWLVLVLLFFLSVGRASAQTSNAQGLLRLNEAIQFFDQGDYVRAERAFATLVAARPTDPAAEYYLALSRMQLGVRTTDAEARRRYFSQAADGLVRVVTQRPELVEARLDLAIARLNQPSRDAAARRILEQYVASSQGRHDAFARFFLGVAAYRLNEFAQALASLDRAEALDEGLVPYTRFYRGLILTRRGRADEARRLLHEVTELAPGTALAQRADTLSQQVEEPPGLAFGGQLRMGIDFDSNVVLLGENTRLPGDLASKEDFRLGIETDFSFSLALPPPALRFGESLTIGIGAATFNSWHAAVDEFDVQTYAGRAFVNYEPLRDLFVGLQYDYDYNLVGREPFLSRNRITPLVKLIEWRDGGSDGPGQARTWTTMYYSFEDRDYFEFFDAARLNRDGSYHTVGLQQEFNLMRLWADDPRWLSARLGYRFLRASTRGDDFDVNANTISAGLNVPLPWKLSLDVSGEWSWEDYSQPSSIDFGRDEREDFVQRYLLGLTRQINPNLAVRAEAIFIFDDANVRDRLGQAPFSHNRGIWGLSVIYSF